MATTGAREAFAWVPDSRFLDAFGDSHIPAEAKRLLTGGGAGRCAGRSTGWARHEASGVPHRLTVLSPVGPDGAHGVTGRVLGAAERAFLRILGEVDRSASQAPPAPPSRPSSLDVVLLLWEARKALPERGRRVDPVHVNTGVCARYPGGRTHVLVYRREEAVKTIAHELLHAYRVADWCNDDPGVLAGSAAVARACLPSAGPRDRRVPQALLPTEAVVDALAVDLCRGLFGGADHEAVLRKARVAARRLASHFGTVDPGRESQSTAAIEYYILKLHLLALAPGLLKAHSAGLQRPDKKAVRRIFNSAPPAEAFRRGLRPGAAAGMSMRMTPLSLTAGVADPRDFS